MRGPGGLATVPPLPSDYRASGWLPHVTSLPSPSGIGDLDLQHLCGSIACIRLAKGGGNRFR